ncbi:hypothetical protein AVEN_242532-1 [Araneus ventricosus]|uniref:Tc1-like transposase DDE domain-containing protein n=1 Tax=Araneus ventricosus TaxID=182803 RepID=A0A4Y2VU81_ARAVE|nr:hypothetical protein AVEN_242532-1 [Araneus ventricosus]
MLKTFVIPELQQCNRSHDAIFMQDSAPPHIHRSVTFRDERVISHGFPTVSLPRSPYLTLCDYWLWGFIKDQVYQEQHAALSHLKYSIIRHARGITEELLRSAVERVLRMKRVGTHIEIM